MRQPDPIPTRVGLIRISAYRPLMRFLARGGARVERHLERVGLPLRAFDRSDALVPMPQLARFAEQVARAEGLPRFGLDAGTAAALDDLGAFGTAIRRSPTVGAMLQALFRGVRSHNSGARWWLEDCGDESVRLCHTFHGARGDSWVQATQFTLAMALATLRLAAGPDWTPRALQLAVGTGRPEPGGHAALGDVPVILHREVTSVTLPRSLLARALPPAPPVAPPQQMDLIDRYTDRDPSTRFADVVIQAVEVLSVGGTRATIASTAAALGLSVRTMQRWLAADGQSFDDLLDRSRLTTARHLLEHTDARVLDIALDLGYSDHAHFTRAFRRWTGVSPLAYRRALLGALRATG